MVSSASARGVMQVMPGTWDWVQTYLAGSRRLNPFSAEDNVRAGALYLRRLLQQSGGDPALAAAGYYQGLASVAAQRDAPRDAPVRRERPRAAQPLRRLRQAPPLRRPA